MELWQSLLVAFGGNAALLLVLGFLGRSLLGNLLNKDLEKFKASLHLIALEHQVRYSQLHEKRAAVLAELYRLLVAATWATESFVSPITFSGEPEPKQRFVDAMNAIADYFRYFDQHRIYLPSELCGALERFATELRGSTLKLGVYQRVENPTSETVQETHEQWEKSWKSVKEEVPKLRAGIEAEFRALLDATRPAV